MTFRRLMASSGSFVGKKRNSSRMVRRITLPSSIENGPPRHCCSFVILPTFGLRNPTVVAADRCKPGSLYLVKGKSVFVCNLLDLERFRWEGDVGGIVGADLFASALAPGKHTLAL